MIPFEHVKEDRKHGEFWYDKFQSLARKRNCNLSKHDKKDGISRFKSDVRVYTKLINTFSLSETGLEL